MTNYKGFGLTLTANELTVLSAFTLEQSTVTFPLGGMSVQETRLSLQSLKQKHLVKGNGPYTLTKKGIRLLPSLAKTFDDNNKE